jgi:ABC-2 type transport system permease protein
MSLSILFRDELNGFYRSKVMLILWVGLPLLSIIIYLAGSNNQEMPVAILSSIVVGTIGGALASAMLAISLINERERRVYDLFLIRPVKRRDILFSKFLAVYLCIAIAGLLAIAVGVAADYLLTGLSKAIDFNGLGQSLVIVFSMMAVSCSVGILIGTVSPSVLVGVILVLYGGNQLAALVILPALLLVNAAWFPPVMAGALSAFVLLASVVVFNRREL